MKKSLLSLALVSTFAIAATTVVVPGTPTVVTVPDGCSLTGSTLTCSPIIIIPPPPPPPTGTCAGFDNTRHISMNWNSPARMFTADVGGFGPGDIVVVDFTTGPTPSAINMIRLAGAEWSDPPTLRNASLSTIPCNFTGQGLPYGGSVVTNQTTVTTNFTVDNPNNYGYYPILHVNTKYYLNVKNVVGQCNTPTCNMAFDLVKYNNP